VSSSGGGAENAEGAVTKTDRARRRERRSSKKGEEMGGKETCSNRDAEPIYQEKNWTAACRPTGKAGHSTESRLPNWRKAETLRLTSPRGYGTLILLRKRFALLVGGLSVGEDRTSSRERFGGGCSLEDLRRRAVSRASSRRSLHPVI